MIEVLFFIAFVIFIIWIFAKVINKDVSPKERSYLEELSSIKLQAREEIYKKEIEHRESIKAVRKDSVNRSRSSLTGKIWEQVVSLIPGFKYNPADMRFLGSPVDYIVFKGMSKKAVEKVIFLEIKTGESNLTEQQEKIKQAVKAGRVEWKEYYVK